MGGPGPTGWGAYGGYHPPGARCPRGARLSPEKAGGKSAMGRCPLDPRSGEEVPPLRTPSLGCGNGKGCVLSAELACGPLGARLLRRAAHRLGGWHRWKGPFGRGRQRISRLCGQNRRWQNRRPAAPQRSAPKSITDFQRPQALEPNPMDFFHGHAPGKKYFSAASVRALRARARSRLPSSNF